MSNFQLSAQGQTLLFTEEGFRAFPYKDSRGYDTIGYGRNLDTRGITQVEAKWLAQNDIFAAATMLDINMPWWRSMSAPRQDCFVNMVFNLGIEGFLDFKNVILNCKAGNFDTAAAALIDSLADKQEPARIAALAAILKTGEYPTNGLGGVAQ